MIQKIEVGDITLPKFGDIIIAMNSTCDEASAIGRPFISPLKNGQRMTLGSVLTFEFDPEKDRYLHMLICHTIGIGGWRDAENYIRFGLDYLWHKDPRREYAIVEIGTGDVGTRDGADEAKIRTSMDQSLLKLTLVKFSDRVMQEMSKEHPLRLLRCWDVIGGEVTSVVASN